MLCSRNRCLAAAAAQQVLAPCQAALTHSSRLTWLFPGSELAKARAVAAKVSVMFSRRDPLRKYIDVISDMSTDFGKLFSTCPELMLDVAGFGPTQ